MYYGNKCEQQGLLGGSRKPIIALVVSIALGCAAGLGEEMLFRGILQGDLNERFGDLVALTSSAVIFGALHAVTPLYAFIAGLASLSKLLPPRKMLHL